VSSALRAAPAISSTLEELIAGVWRSRGFDFFLAMASAVHPSGAERTQRGHIAPFDREVW
jgi:hypothetical protein